MTDESVLGIDQGTGSTKGVVLTTAGEEVASFSTPTPPRVTEGRSVHQDPSLLLSSVNIVLEQATAWASSNKRSLRAIGVALQRSCVTAWNSQSGQAAHPMLTWADTSTYRIIENLGSTAHTISQRTGIPTIPNFSGAKIGELQKKFPGVTTLVGTLDSFLLYQLSERKLFATDDTMAARSMLYDLHKGTWAEDLARLFTVDVRRLPVIKASIDDYTLVDGVPVKVIIGDQQAALLGRATTEKRPLLNLGTIASLLVPTGETPLLKPGLTSSVWYSKRTDRPPPSKDRYFSYVSELTSPITGPLIQELVDKKKLVPSLSELSHLCSDSRRRGANVLVYSQNGLSLNPKWPNGVPDVIIKDAATAPEDITRGYVENVGNIVVSMAEQLEQYKIIFDGQMRTIMVAGGGSELDYLVQYVADCADATLIRLPSREATARGAALATLITDDAAKGVLALNTFKDAVYFRPSDPERRKGYVKWKRLEQDVSKGIIPVGAGIVERVLPS